MDSLDSTRNENRTARSEGPLVDQPFVSPQPAGRRGRSSASSTPVTSPRVPFLPSLAEMYTSSLYPTSSKSEKVLRSWRAMMARLLLSGLLGIVLIASTSYLLIASDGSVTEVFSPPAPFSAVDLKHVVDLKQEAPAKEVEDPCEGRRVYMLNMGGQFNRDLLYGKEEKGVYGRGTGINGGFGEEKKSTAKTGPTKEAKSNCTMASNCPIVVTENWPKLKSTWYDTWANALDVVFHSRMERYRCLVKTESKADLVFLVYYGSLDISRHLGQSALGRGSLGAEISERLVQRERYQSTKGRDHFVVVGRPLWDFVSNLSDPNEPWGTDFFSRPAMKHVKIVTVEASVWSPNTIGVPYTTAFHPPSRAQMLEWREFVEGYERPYLFAFGGAVRRGARQASIQRAGIIRERVFWQCQSSERCRLLDCENPPHTCEQDWRVFTQLYLSSQFCIQPHGDSCTRRAVLDGMLAGCIPVVLDKCTVEHQYQWLLGNPENFSVYIDGTTLKSPPEADTQAQSASVQVGTGEVMLEEVLSAIPQERVKRMQRLVLDFIPHITFGGGSDGKGAIVPPDFEDAFDRLIQHLASTVKEEMAKS